MATSVLTSKGQTTIPKSVRDHLGIGPGARLEFVILGDGRVMMTPATVSVTQLAGLLRRKGSRPITLEEMEKAIRRRGARKA